MPRPRANNGDRPLLVTANTVKRIGRAVNAFERGDRDTHGQTFPQIPTDEFSARLCKTSSAWTKGTLATLNVWESGTPPSEGQSSGVTLTDCVNKFADVGAGKFVIVIQIVTGRWYLIAAEC